MDVWNACFSNGSMDDDVAYIIMVTSPFGMPISRKVLWMWFVGNQDKQEQKRHPVWARRVWW